MRTTWLKLLVLALLLFAVPTASMQGDLPPVIPVANPDSFQNAYVTWDWQAFGEEWYSAPPPDPLAIQLPDAYMGSLPSSPFDLAQVRFLDDANLDAAQRDLLAQNGFVVVPGGLDQFEDPYRSDSAWDINTGHGYWVTTDAMLHALYVAFSNLLNFLETDELYTRVDNVALESYQAAWSQYEAARGSALEAPARAAALYYAVALGLLDPDAYAGTVDPALQADAGSLIAAANTAEGRLDVPFLPGYQEDFSQYKPRGHYTTGPEQEQYFRAMMWLGRITFLARDDSSLQASLLALRAMEQSGAVADWAAVSDTLAYFIGPTDNLGPAEYLPLAQSIYGADLPLDTLADTNRLAQFRAEVQALPGPRINNVVRPLGTEAEQLDEATRGFRLFGQRFTFDGYAMQRLIYPYVGEAGNERALPAGLDVAAALGSDVAYGLLAEQGDTSYANYDTNMSGLRAEVNQISGADWLENFYGGWLMALQPLWNRTEQPYPSLMNSDAWRRRDLQAGLGSWAELKHATVLYAAQPMGGLGGGGEYVADTTNYVEPNPLVFSRIAVLAASAVQGLDARGFAVQDYSSGAPSGSSMIREAFFRLAILSAQAADMANKHLWGIALTDEEQIFLKYHFGSSLWYVRYASELALEEPPKMAAIVTDVASNPDAGTVLQVGTGYVDYIYVITDSPQGLQLTRGSVYSYYEFVNAIDNRLTDEDWRALVQAGDVPARTGWINSFFAE
ncbi:MAG: DUF3160 domain-containing protein [Anaerolineae bacterium]|nr:DUF3160 domain-containing protein [Anaerolineae bacterium]